MSTEKFWQAVHAQLAELRSAGTADDVLRILAPENDPYWLLPGYEPHGGAPGFFAGSGGEATVADALFLAGWRVAWARARYWYAMTAPDGTSVTYVEGDIYPGSGR